MKKIEEDLLLDKDDGSYKVTVYKGGFGDLQKVELEWHEEENEEEFLSRYGVSTKHLMLSEIVEQCGPGLITVFIHGPLNGTVLQYGNYGNEWWKIGKLDGYA